MGLKFFDDYKIKHLLVGDLICGDVAIECKTAQDFINSIKGEGRVFQQAENMFLNFKNPWVVIIGTFEQYQKSMYARGKKPGFTKESYNGAIASIQMDEDHPVNVKEVKNNKNYFEFAKIIFKQGNTEKPEYKKVKRLKLSSDDAWVNAIQCADGVGMKKAYDIAQIFKTPHDLCHAEIDDIIHSVDGVGVAVASKVKKLYNTESS
jgi:ERCC4-type nuclease